MSLIGVAAKLVASSIMSMMGGNVYVHVVTDFSEVNPKFVQKIPGWEVAQKPNWFLDLPGTVKRKIADLLHNEEIICNLIELDDKITSISNSIKEQTIEVQDKSITHVMDLVSQSKLKPSMDIVNHVDYYYSKFDSNTVVEQQMLTMQGNDLFSYMQNLNDKIGSCAMSMSVSKFYTKNLMAKTKLFSLLRSFVMSSNIYDFKSSLNEYVQDFYSGLSPNTQTKNFSVESLSYSKLNSYGYVPINYELDQYQVKTVLNTIKYFKLVFSPIELSQQIINDQFYLSTKDSHDELMVHEDKNRLVKHGHPSYFKTGLKLGVSIESSLSVTMIEKTLNTPTFISQEKVFSFNSILNQFKQDQLTHTARWFAIMKNSKNAEWVNKQLKPYKLKLNYQPKQDKLVLKHYFITVAVISPNDVLPVEFVEKLDQIEQTLNNT